MYIKCVDKFRESTREDQSLLVHCFVTPSNSKFLLLHENKPEDQIKAFFNEVYELYTKLTLSPFFDPNQKVNVSSFQMRVSLLAKKTFI